MEVELPFRPGLTLHQEIGAVLLARMCDLFPKRDFVAIEGALERAEADYETLTGEVSAHILAHPVLIRIERSETVVL